MASVSTDPRYRTLAGVAMDELGASSPLVALAIVSQWQCEQPSGAWPPVHNNPGFVTVGALASVGVAAAYAKTSPGAHFLAQFPTPEAGARAYGQLIARGKRYRPALAAARAGDGVGYLSAITSAGYGTRYSCAIGAYTKLAGGSSSAAPPGPVPHPSPAPTPAPVTAPTATGTVVAVFGAHLATDCKQVTILAPGLLGGSESAIPIPRENIGDPCTQCPPGYNMGIVDPGPLRNAGNPFAFLPGLSLLPFSLAGSWVNPSDVPGQANACVKAGLGPGDHTDLSTGEAVVGQAAGALAGAIFGGLEPLLWLAAFLILAVLGLYLAVKE